MSTQQQYYLKEMTVAIPKDALTIIRKGKRVEYETDRVYLPEEMNTRVKRRTIGKVDPVNPERMFPNEAYFELFPENEVPKEIRDEFLRDCAFRRVLKGWRQADRNGGDDPAESAACAGRAERGDGSAEFAACTGRAEQGDGSAEFAACTGRAEQGDGSAVPHSRNGQNNSTFHRLHPPLAAASETPPVLPMVPKNESLGDCPQVTHVLVRRIFDEMYFAIEELAGKFPNEVMDPFKAEKINEVLKEIRGMVGDEKITGYLRLIDEPEILTVKGEEVTKGLTYSDVLLLMKWYKVLPR